MFWIAVIPAFLCVSVLIWKVREPYDGRSAVRRAIRCSDLAELTGAYWWTVALAGLLSLARFSSAFLAVKAHSIGMEPALVPIVFVLMNLFFGVTAYPFGALSDRSNPRFQLAIGIVLLIGADFALAMAGTIWMMALGAVLWGLHMGVVHGSLSAMVANAAPKHLRGTAFGIYDLVFGGATFLASLGAGFPWTVGGAEAAFGAGASCALLAAVMLLVRVAPKRRAAVSEP